MRKTKIICTLGPATDREGVLRALVENGMNGDYSWAATAKKYEEIYETV